MRAVALAALVLLLAAAMVSAEEVDPLQTIVAARFVSCSGCRLNRMPRVRSFLQNEVPHYPATWVDWIGGHAPEVHFLNKYKKVVTKFDLGPYDEEQLHALLHQHNIHQSTPAPNFEPPSFEKTSVCAAWRQTANCDPNGEREPLSDESCFTEIANGRSGFCECVNRPNVEFSCEHTPISCEYMCRDSVADDSPVPLGDDEEEHEEF